MGNSLFWWWLTESSVHVKRGLAAILTAGDYHDYVSGNAWCHSTASPAPVWAYQHNGLHKLRERLLLSTREPIEQAA
jgi:hypothetical protein